MKHSLQLAAIQSIVKQCGGGINVNHDERRLEFIVAMENERDVTTRNTLKSENSQLQAYRMTTIKRELLAVHEKYLKGLMKQIIQKQKESIDDDALLEITDKSSDDNSQLS